VVCPWPLEPHQVARAFHFRHEDLPLPRYRRKCHQEAVQICRQVLRQEINSTLTTTHPLTLIHKASTKRCSLFGVKTILSPCFSYIHTHKLISLLFFSHSLFSLFYNSIFYVYVCDYENALLSYSLKLWNRFLRENSPSQSINQSPSKETEQHRIMNINKQQIYGDLQFSSQKQTIQSPLKFENMSATKYQPGQTESSCYSRNHLDIF